ncbi:MAG: ABC transporter permease [Mollicutes bacterium]|nr:ABC transporter permease [Mollicutes bacterium]
MKDALIVARFTAIEAVKKKSFKITLAIILLGIIIAFNIPNIIKLFKDNDSNKNDTILVIDQKDIYKGLLENLNSMELGYKFEITKDSKTSNEIKDLLEKDEIEAAIDITEETDGIKLNYLTESIGFGSVLVDESIFTELYKVVKLGELGLSEKDIAYVNAPLLFEITELGEGGSINLLGVAMGLCMVLFFAIFYCANQVSASITQEKTSKIIDTLITSVSPRSIVVGKTLGIGLVGLMEVVAVITTAFVSYKLFFPKDILTGIIDLSNVTFGFVLISIIYFILGYTLYAFIYALCGSLISKPEDLGQASGLISIVALIGFYLAYFSMMNPASSLNKLASLLPISSPFSVPARFITRAISIEILLISIIILILSIALIAYCAIKIYSSAILNYGTKVDLKTMIEMFKQKDN